MLSTYQLKIVLFGATMIIQMNLAIGISYESEIFMRAVPQGVIGDRSIYFSQLQDAYNYSDGQIDYILIAQYVGMLVCVHLSVLYVLNYENKQLNRGQWMYKL